MTKSGLTHVFGRQTFSHRTILFAHSHSTVLSHANKNPPNCLQHLLIKNESPSLSSSVSKLTDIVRRVPSNVCFPFTVENILVKYSSCLIFICRLYLISNSAAETEQYLKFDLKSLRLDEGSYRIK